MSCRTVGCPRDPHPRGRGYCSIHAPHLDAPPIGIDHLTVVPERRR